MKILTPRTMTTDLSTAHKAAIEAMEPIFVPSQVFTDDRGWSLMNQMIGIITREGQINYSVQYPNVVKGWHRHKLQTDFWMCVQGHLKVGLYHEESDRAWAIVTGEKRPGVVIIPPPLWHGAATVGPTPAALLYYLTHQFNPQQPDEARRAWDSVVGFPWAPENK
jgi:dTDP-4-dehydrorhamnose 3,5-epimerase